MAPDFARGGPLQDAPARENKRSDFAFPAAGVMAVLLVTVFFTVASYPGFMSYDSLEALRQARSHVEGSQYPPFGSYVWRVLDWIWPGPSLMQLFQNALLLGSLVWILHSLRWNPIAQVVTVIAVAALPPLTGTMLVVWKDVAMAAFYAAGFAALVHARLRALPGKIWIAFGVLLLFCGMAYRFNAASGALPLLIYAVWVARARSGRREIVRAALGGTGLVLVLFVLVLVVNSFRFPSMERLERNTNMDGIMRYDLIGISRFSGESVTPARDGGMVDVAYLRKIYDPRHVNITAANDVEHRVAVQEPGEIARYWVAAIRQHPGDYLRHRAAVFREYIGLHRHEPFYVTHPSVDENKLGISHTPNALTPVAVGYVWKARYSILERAWVYYVAGLLSLVVFLPKRNRRFAGEAVAALGSGLLYLAPMFFISPAADVRYNFWSIWGALLCLVFVVSSLLAARSDGRAS
ncbi:hypothetical protein JJB11_00645 [Ramlibacter ginsenosidimutans]|uniref:Uncharacterized protein n=1 Tax=Ramlibacter ginsenosidimutans TaxID=502333 RepID=A0A934TNI2_9BURK|nr:hypothetical protein [Ramlibacter ginsenosidimutans]MBK6004583.1 hypothetical protein [Ramlibacter ginsenosidimutans]